jgi:hypothetical protein
MNREAVILLSAAIVLVSSVVGRADEELPEVQGVLGLSAAAQETTYLAIHVPVPADHALASIAWYNNDAGAVFPRLLAGAGYPEGPGSIQDALVVAESVVGGSSQWSTVEFSEPVGSLNPGLYLMFEFPTGLPYLGPGAGGGPAVGYCRGTGSDGGGWISGDGEEWYPLARDYRFAIVPSVVPIEGGTTMLRRPLGGGASAVIEPFLAVSPNPANPEFLVRFAAREAGRVVLDVYNVRGELVVRLLDEELEAGAHQAVWGGRDRRGQSVSSGLYFLRLRLSDRVLTKRVTLLR